MLKAYDTWLNTTVSADLASKNCNNDAAFRYKCLCCGEEVFLAAEDSLSKATHFRHRSGNNDKECELYLSQQQNYNFNNGNLYNNQNIDFYYDDFKKLFSISLRFSDLEIQTYETSNASIEIKTTRHSQPFFSKKIDTQSFCGNIAESFILNEYASPYYISNTTSKSLSPYMIFNDSYPTFFKILGNGKDSFKAKQIKSHTLYTGIKYFIAWVGRNTAQIKLKQLPGIKIQCQSEFQALGNRTIWSMVVVFNEKNSEIEQQLKEWGYSLDISEKLTLLWPPAYDSNEIKIIDQPKAFFFSTFKFYNHGNISLDSNMIYPLSDNTTQVNISNDLKISEKNVEVEIKRENLNVPYNPIDIEETYSNKLAVSKNQNRNKFYLFSSQGVKELYIGQNIYLTPNSYVAEYQSTHLLRRIFLPNTNEISLEEKVKDILTHYWVLKPYASFKTQKYPSYIHQYILDCQKKGNINCAIEKILREISNE